MAEKTLFSKIIDREIPAKIEYEDELCLAFHDINPQAPVHILVIPKRPIVRLSDATPADQALLGHLLLKAAEIAKKMGLVSYRIVNNDGADAGQTVFHLHFHILGGRRMKWPPG